MLTHAHWKNPGGTRIVALHWLGGAAATWQALATELTARGFDVVALDLPGFGDARDDERRDSRETSDAIIDAIESLRSYDGAPWLLAGHSMGGRFATIVSHALAHHSLAGVVLVSSSTLVPEPMDEKKRDELIRTLGTVPSEENAAAFVRENVGFGLDPVAMHDAVEIVLRANPRAIRAWFERGSREDWSSTGVSPCEALVMCGDREGPLGESAQRSLVAPMFTRSEVVVLHGAGHLGPIEQPATMAELIESFAKRLGLALSPPAPVLSDAFVEAIQSAKTSEATRNVLRERLAPSPRRLLSSPERVILDALVGAVVSSEPSRSFRVARRTEDAMDTTDGQRPGPEPALTAWKNGLTALEDASMRTHGVGFAALTSTAREALLLARHDDPWLVGARARIISMHVSDPETLDQMHFQGFARG